MTDPTQQQTSQNLLEKTQALVDSLKAQNDRAEAIAIRNEEAVSRMMLGGGTTGNIQQPQISEAQKIKEGAKNFFKDTALEKAIEKYNG